MALAPAFILKGTLFLSASHPAFFHKSSSTLWFSKSNVVKAHEHSNGILIEAEEKGYAYAQGLNQDSQNPLKIIVVSDKNWEALQKCPQSPISWNESIGIIENTKALSEIKQCGYDEIALSNQSQVEIENSVKLRESQLISLGLNIQRSYWKNGQRTIEIIKNNFETLLPQINSVLNELFPIYQWRLVEVASPGRTLLFELTLFEFSQHRARELGLEWPKRVPILALQGNLAQRGDGNSLIAFADFGESQGVGKIIAQPQLRCKPGEKAIFQNGGELPITSTSAYQSKTEWKPYGLQLQLEAAPDISVGAQEITISFSLDVSEPDMATALNGIPGLSSKKLQSRFDLRNDETTLLSTLLQKRESKNRSGLAFLTQIPLLSYLFSNENQQAQQSELWIAIKSSWEEGKMKNPDSVKVNYDF